MSTFNGTCYNCNKAGHQQRDCTEPRRAQAAPAADNGAASQPRQRREKKPKVAGNGGEPPAQQTAPPPPRSAAPATKAVAAAAVSVANHSTTAGLALEMFRMDPDDTEARLRFQADKVTGPKRSTTRADIGTAALRSIGYKRHMPNLILSLEKIVPPREGTPAKDIITITNNVGSIGTAIRCTSHPNLGPTDGSVAPVAIVKKEDGCHYWVLATQAVRNTGSANGVAVAESQEAFALRVTDATKFKWHNMPNLTDITVYELMHAEVAFGPYYTYAQGDIVGYKAAGPEIVATLKRAVQQQTHPDICRVVQWLGKLDAAPVPTPFFSEKGGNLPPQSAVAFIAWLGVFSMQPELQREVYGEIRMVVT